MWPIKCGNQAAVDRRGGKYEGRERRNPKMSCYFLDPGSEVGSERCARTGERLEVSYAHLVFKQPSELNTSTSSVERSLNETKWACRISQARVPQVRQLPEALFQVPTDKQNDSIGIQRIPTVHNHNYVTEAT